ncbi:hypothetical protein OUZ56_029005 [Daphnia magna]|uniref:GMP synthase n=1 Tax=Daphnia magna TaxID=35525 RepID=A0ABR0B5K3_9CRUS|nr:hypothetical protein OUZ56_029005 [Daphnia magna]
MVRTVENVVTRPEIKEILSIMAWLTRQWRKKGVGEPGDCSVRIRDQHLSSRQRDAYRLSVLHPEFLLTYANSCFEELKTSFVICNLDKNRQEPTVQSLISRRDCEIRSVPNKWDNFELSLKCPELIRPS